MFPSLVPKLSACQTIVLEITRSQIHAALEITASQIHAALDLPPSSLSLPLDDAEESLMRLPALRMVVFVIEDASCHPLWPSVINRYRRSLPKLYSRGMLEIVPKQ